MIGVPEDQQLAVSYDVAENLFLGDPLRHGRPPPHSLTEPLPTVEIARRLTVTPSAVSQHLQVLHATGMITRARDGRRVLYRRSPLGDQLVDQSAGR
ncbi:ArsR/SmtB family transcription factor [Salinispora vitiensis]|uniref:ArsR/SmtB family transcription factor n=1 Tax=Salinispora vitiensis TaxID=999544 RepID=UPI00295B1130|nr:MarR family transcriptional regulator [Salinispora vitiensis]